MKAGTDDRCRCSAMDIVAQLVVAGAQVRAYDPSVSGPVRDLPDIVVFAGDPYNGCVGAEVVAVVNVWEEFTMVGLDQVRETTAVARMLEAGYLFDSGTVRDAGFEYVSLGNR